MVFEKVRHKCCMLWRKVIKLCAQLFTNGVLSFLTMSTRKNRFFTTNNEHKWAGPWENVSYVICEQQRRRSACAFAQSDQRLCSSLLRWYNISRFYSRNFKTLASFSGCAGRFVSGLVGNSRRHVLSCRGSIRNTTNRTFIIFSTPQRT